MAELVDAQVSGTCDRFGRGSSSLLQGTTKKPPFRVAFLWCIKGKVLELPEGSLTTSGRQTGVCRWRSRPRSGTSNAAAWLRQVFFIMLKRLC